MSWDTIFKESNVSIHVIATGAGASIQKKLWEVPGSSAYLSGASFPYSTEETTELLGFRPESFCSQDTAIDLASAAYMKAYRFGGKKPVGLGVTAAVASDKEHRGQNRFHTCVMTSTHVLLLSWILEKQVGMAARQAHDEIISRESFELLSHAITLGINGAPDDTEEYEDVSARAFHRFLQRRFFTASGERLGNIVKHNHVGLMSGAFNPPHEGHLGAAEAFTEATGKRTVFEITAVPPHKAALSVQECLQRAKLLQGYDRVFSVGNSLYLDKARTYPGMPLVLGADAVVRMLDPKWGVNTKELLREFKELGTKFYVFGRKIDDKFVSGTDIVNNLPDELSKYGYLFNSLEGRWDISSTEIRNKNG